MRKKFTTILCLLVALIMLLAACGGTEPEVDEPQAGGETVAEEEPVAEEEAVEEEPEAEEPMEEEAAGEPVTIEWWHIQSDPGPHQDAWQEMADAYMAEHPNVTIDITILENEAFKQRLTTVMQSGDPPDLFQSWGGGTMNTYAEAGLMRDISPELEGGWGDSFGAGALGVYSYQGKYYGVPWDMGMVGFWYNTDLFAEAGIDGPPETWEEFLADVQTLKDAGITPIALGEGEQWPGHFYWTYLAARIGGQEAFNAAASREGAFTDEPFVQAGEELLRLIELEPFQEGFMGASHNDSEAIMGDGEAAMLLMGQWAPEVMRVNSSSGEGLGDALGFFPFPAVEGGAGARTDAMGGGNGIGVGADAPDEAVDFLRYLTSVENQIVLTEIGAIIPVVEGADEHIEDPNMVKVFEGVNQADYFQLYYDQYLPPAVGVVINEAVQQLFAGTMTPEEVAQTIDEAYVQEVGQ
jgi:raffinose/stachyose/melibiose transport system substrate-binding protein